MAKRRASRPVLDPLERRELMVGFYEGPAHYTQTVRLIGAAQGVATIVAPKGHSSGPNLNISISAGGKLTGRALWTVSGSLHSKNGVEVGTLQLHSSSNSLTVNLVGPIVNPSSPSPAILGFTGQGQGPGSSNEAFTPEDASGTVVISVTPVAGREKVTLVFRST